MGAKTLKEMENFEQDLDTQGDWLNEQCTRYAFPGQVMAFVGNSEQLVPTQGMTKREAFAMAAMQGMLSACQGTEGSQSGQEYIAKISVTMADELLKQLEGK